MRWQEAGHERSLPAVPMSSAALRVLIIEDDEDTREGLRELLELHGYSCVEAPDGDHGLELLRSEYFDLALLDWKMNRMNGRELLSLRERDDRLCVTPLLVLTAAAVSEAELSRFRNVTLLSKPFAVDQLLQWMDGALGARRSG